MHQIRELMLKNRVQQVEIGSPELGLHGNCIVVISFRFISELTRHDYDLDFEYFDIDTVADASYLNMMKSMYMLSMYRDRSV
jgi:hypothetical protein